MSNICYYIILFITLIFLNTCSSTFSIQEQKVTEQVVSISLPTTEIALPPINDILLFPTPELKEIDIVRKNITENFSARDKAHIKVSDPQLFGGENSMIIHLAEMSKENYAFPLPNAKVISPYAGKRRHHSGIDLKTYAKDTIKAAFDGIVRIAKPYAAYGNVIVIRHYNGLETIYSHNHKNLVKVDEKVKAGDPIGLTGRTGRATTAHLHFEVRINGQHFNPNLIFDFKTQKLQTTNLVASKNGVKITVEPLKIYPHHNMDIYQYSLNDSSVIKPNRKGL